MDSWPALAVFSFLLRVSSDAPLQPWWYLAILRHLPDLVIVILGCTRTCRHTCRLVADCILAFPWFEGRVAFLKIIDGSYQHVVPPSQSQIQPCLRHAKAIVFIQAFFRFVRLARTQHCVSLHSRREKLLGRAGVQPSTLGYHLALAIIGGSCWCAIRLLGRDCPDPVHAVENLPVVRTFIHSLDQRSNAIVMPRTLAALIWQ